MFAVTDYQGVWIIQNVINSDRDRYPDEMDEFPFDPKEWVDSDGDGVGNNRDSFPLNRYVSSWWQIIYYFIPFFVIGSLLMFIINRKYKTEK